MLYNLLNLLLGLGIILLGCELFTNGTEWLGKRLRVGDGVVGSLFSAVGTCLPETMIPVAAILLAPEEASSVDIGIGAIMGAPFMLSTLAFFITGLSVILFSRQRGSGLNMNVNKRILRRDLVFFIIPYALGVAASYVESREIRVVVALLLIIVYIIYVYRTVKTDASATGTVRGLYFKKGLGFSSNKPAFFLQITAALSAIMLGARMFVDSMGYISAELGMSALVLALVAAPIATELPEKLNSVIWIRRGKDTLAMGNITGAMVFQSCIPVALGILATPWRLDRQAIFSAFLALVSASTTYLWIKAKDSLRPLPLLSGGVFYGFFLYYMLTMGLK